MAPSNQGDDNRALRVSEFVVLLAAIISTVSVIAPALGLEQNTLFAVTLPILFGLIFFVVAGRRVLSTRTIPTRIAIGGSPGAGKTVYTNVVAGRLGESESSILRFTPEARTAQQIYTTISDLRRKRWPPSTGRDEIDRYRGKVELLNRPFYSRLAQGRIEIDLELGDSAGQLWDEVADADRREPSRLIESTFFEYVGESSALLYFIAADTLQNDPTAVADHVDDLLSTLQVLRSIEVGGRPQLTKPIGVIISKADLLTDVELRTLRSVFDDTPSDPDARALEPGFCASMERIEHLTIVMSRQVRAFEGFIVSALRAAQRPAGSADSLVRVERPIEWAIRQVLRS